jgi:hypothetical protein
VLLVTIGILGVNAFSHANHGVGSGTSTMTGSNEVLDRAGVELRRAIVAVREAEAAGADQGRLRDLVDQLNLAVWMIDRGEQLLTQGDVGAVVAQSQLSIDLSTRLVSEAGKLRDESAQRTYYGMIFTFAMVPVASLLVTVVAHYGWVWWRRREFESLMRMEIKRVSESEEEKR